MAVVNQHKQDKDQGSGCRLRGAADRGVANGVVAVNALKRTISKALAALRIRFQQHHLFTAILFDCLIRSDEVAVSGERETRLCWVYMEEERLISKRGGGGMTISVPGIR